MSKVRIPINPLQVGRVGAYSMYVRNGEQIVRQRNNSSNYGDSASRTEAQMLRRVKWANLVNFYKASAFWMPKSFESKKSNQTVYNAFMAANINKSTVALSKQLAEEGCCICEALQISKGSLASIDFNYSDSTHMVNTGLKTNAAITGTTTVGELSAGIIATMHDFQNGDNVAWVKYVQDLNRDSEQNVHPRLLCFYYELTLDSSSTVLLSAHPLAQYFETTPSTFEIIVGDAQDIFEEGIGFVLIHTRRTSGLKVSSQNVFMVSTELVDEFSSQQWVQDCIDSYGVDTEVPLDPSFSQATGVEIAYLGSRVWYEGYHNVRIERTEGGELLISGQGLSSKTIQVKFKAQGSDSFVDWTPLSVDAAGWHYIISGDGTARIYVNGYHPCDIAVSGIEPPAGLLPHVRVGLKADDGASSTGVVDGVTVNAYCNNYNRKSTAELPYFYLAIRTETGTSPTLSSYTCVNCAIQNLAKTEQDEYVQTRTTLAVTDPSLVAYVEYQGMIVAVFNYE